MIAKEEEQIRKDPIAQTTELLKKVFEKEINVLSIVYILE